MQPLNTSRCFRYHVNEAYNGTSMTNFLPTYRQYIRFVLREIDPYSRCEKFQNITQHSIDFATVSSLPQQVYNQRTSVRIGHKVSDLKRKSLHPQR